MTEHHRDLALQVVHNFRDSLSHEAREYISSAHLEDLTAAIHQLLSHEHEHIADLLEAVVRTLRTGVDKPDLDL